jgi:hypothetical protein
MPNQPNHFKTPYLGRFKLPEPLTFVFNHGFLFKMVKYTKELLLQALLEIQKGRLFL